MRGDYLQEFFDVAIIVGVLGLLGSAIGFILEYYRSKKESQRIEAREAMVSRLLPFYGLLLKLQAKLYLLWQGEGEIDLKEIRLSSREYSERLGDVLSIVRDQPTQQMVANLLVLLEMLDILEARDYHYDSIRDTLLVILEHIQELHNRIEWYVSEYSTSLEQPPKESSFPEFEPDTALRVHDVTDELMTQLKGYESPLVKPIQEYDIERKVIVLGDGNTGKSAILTRLMHGWYKTGYRTTIGCQFYARNFTIENKCVRLKLWDMAGQSRFAILRPMYYRSAKAAVFVYDVTQRPTFANVMEWAIELFDTSELECALLLANKSDHPDRVVSFEEGQQLMQQLEELLEKPVIFYEVSAVQGTNIQEAFTELVQRIVTCAS